jgi:hypothetical protein
MKTLTVVPDLDELEDGKAGGGTGSEGLDGFALFLTHLAHLCSRQGIVQLPFGPDFIFIYRMHHSASPIVGTAMDRDGFYLLLYGHTAVLTSLATLHAAAVRRPFPKYQ